MADSPQVESYIEVATPMVSYEEKVPTSEQVTIFPGPQKSLRELLGVKKESSQGLVHHQEVPHFSAADPGVSSESSVQYANLQPVPYPASTHISPQIAASPGEASDDSGVSLLSPGQCSLQSHYSPAVSSVPQAAAYTTVTIDEPQTQAQIIDMVPGKVRCINMRRELEIDGQSISYLLEGVLVAPNVKSSGFTSAPVVGKSRRSSEDSNFSDEITIDGQPISAALRDILTDVSETPPSQDALSNIISHIPVAAMTNEAPVNQVMIDGKLLFQNFDLFSQPPANMANEYSQVPKTLHTTEVNTAAEKQLAMQNVSVAGSSGTVSSRGLQEGSITSPTLTDIQETAQTLINMASMPVDGAQPVNEMTAFSFTSTCPSNSTAPEPLPGTSADSVDGRPEVTAFSDTLSSFTANDNLQQLLNVANNNDLDILIDTVHDNVKRNSFITKEFLDNLPELEKKFLVRNSRFWTRPNTLAYDLL